MIHNSPILRKVLVLLATSGLLGAAFLTATQPALGVGISPCTSVDLFSNPYQVAIPGEAITLTASATWCTTPEFQFYLQPPGGAWAAQGAYSTNPVFDWTTTTTGTALGVWGIGVHARASGRTAAYDVYYLGTYNLVVLYCGSASLFPNIAPPSLPGLTPITFTATSVGCISPEYKFLALPPGGTWSTVRAYGTGNTFTWNTTGLKAGTWTIGVWARQPGSRASYDAYGFITYRLILPAKCRNVAGTTNLPSPQTAGTSVEFFVESTGGCGSAQQYEFWRLAPGGAWARVQAYSGAATWTWDTTGVATGRYEIMLRARTGTTALYDTYVIWSYFIGT